MRNLANLFLTPAIVLLLSMFSGESPPAMGAEGTAVVDSAAHQTRRRIEVLYRRWDDGLFGSRRFHRRELQAYLAGGVGERIATGYDYPLIYPEVLAERRFRCRFRYGDWLEISGEIDEAGLRALSGGGLPEPSRWWRGPVLVSLEGKLKRFRLDDGPPRRVVVVLGDLRPGLPKGSAPAAGERRDR